MEKNNKNCTKTKKHQSNNEPIKNYSSKNFIALLILSVFLGFFGIHRFYANKIGTGLIWLFTFGLFGIGYICDIILITAQSFEDSKGKTIAIHS